MTSATDRSDPRIARPQVRDLPAYNAGLSSDVVRQRYGVDQIARRDNTQLNEEAATT